MDAGRSWCALHVPVALERQADRHSCQCRERVQRSVLEFLSHGQQRNITRCAAYIPPVDDVQFLSTAPIQIRTAADIVRGGFLFALIVSNGTLIALMTMR